MFLQTHRIDKDSFITDIVTQDYRTADVFKKYGIEYCCGGKWPLELICETKGLDCDGLLEELQHVTRTIHVPNSLQFANWSVDFLTEYIINVHHNYLKKSLEKIQLQLKHFTEKHVSKYPELAELERVFNLLADEMHPHLLEEEEIIFPYIRQMAHSYNEKDSYGRLFVRTLRKPLEAFLHNDHESTGMKVHKMRELTQNYSLPQNACVQHRVLFSILKELDNDLVQHLHLENNILFPKAITMVKELLK